MKILAVTACPAGVAHTYMAANAIKKEAEARGHEIIVEKQGSMGIEDEISMKDIKDADVAIFAVAISVEFADRFDGMQILEVEIGDALKDPKKIIDATEALAGRA